MKKLYSCAAAFAVLLTVAPSKAATFRVETHSRGYAVYSTATKPERCEIVIYFTFTLKGVRDNGESLCTLRDVPKGKDVKFCEFSHERMVDPVVSKPPKVTCHPAE